MLEVLRGREVSDVVAVVTRWFGGVLLGAGGLVRAYGDAGRETLDAAGVRRRLLLERYDVLADHADAGRLESDLRAREVRVLGVDYAERATLHLAVPAVAADGFAALLAELTGGGPAPEATGPVWVDA
jgi:putative IMPACT (imprinted ancient) family translation regulator